MGSVKAFIRRLFSLSTAPKAVDISVCDCMVGVVRSPEQLKANIAHCFYHTPSRNVYELDMPVKYVALYTSAKTFGEENAGVRYIGKISHFEEVPRFMIAELPKDSRELYFVFHVESWEKLENPIKPLETASVITMTNYNLLMKSEYMPEISLHSWEEFRLFQFLKRICLNNADGERYNFNGTKITAKGNTIEIIFSNGVRRKIARSVYNGRPYALLKLIKLNSRP